MNSIALLKVAEILEALPDNRNFSLDEWKEDVGCGTVACAIGHAAMHPWFTRRKLKITKNEDYYELYFGPYVSWRAVRKFFRLNPAEASYLFSSYEYPVSRRKKRKYVANRIRSFVKKNKGTMNHFYVD